MGMDGAAIRRSLVVGTLCVLTALTAARAEGPAPASPPAAEAAAPAPQRPIQISADAAEYFNKESRVVFTGNVVAVQAESTLTSQRMEVTFSQPQAPAGGAGEVGAPAAGRRITQIVAQQSVTFRQVDAETGKERFATGEQGVYDAEQRLVTMTGNPRLWEGKSLIVGDEIVFHLDDKNVNVRGKVNLTMYPDEAKETKKP